MGQRPGNPPIGHADDFDFTADFILDLGPIPEARRAVGAEAELEALRGVHAASLVWVARCYDVKPELAGVSRRGDRAGAFMGHSQQRWNMDNVLMSDDYMRERNETVRHEWQHAANVSSGDNKARRGRQSGRAAVIL